MLPAICFTSFEVILPSLPASFTAVFNCFLASILSALLATLSFFACLFFSFAFAILFYSFRSSILRSLPLGFLIIFDISSPPYNG